jgi:sulfite reductase (NADPH) flavoprotein alpha-component
LRHAGKLILALLALTTALVWQMEDLGSGRQWLATLVLSAYALLLWWAKVRRQRQQPAVSGEADYLIAYATETGTARQLAQQMRKRLGKQGCTAALTELNRLADQSLPAKALLLVASTTGQGDAPRTGDRWPTNDDLKRYVDLPFAVLALGDRSYPQFCAFGLSVAGQLQQAGAKPLFAPVQVSQADPAMVNYWYQCLQKAADIPV